jgi:hypothetical protein
LSDKARFYEALKGNSNFNIPEYRVVNNAADFEKAYYDIKGRPQGMLQARFVRGSCGLSDNRPKRRFHRQPFFLFPAIRFHLKA